MIRRVAFILLSFSVISQSFSQDFDLNNYKFRYQNYRGFTLGSSLENSGDQRFVSTTIKPDSIFTFENDFTNGLYFNFSAEYFSNTNTEDLQKTSVLSISENLSLNNNRRDDDQYGKDGRKTLSSNMNNRFAQTIRKYNGNKFTLIDYNLYSYLNNNNSKYINENEISSTSARRFSITKLNFKLGKGSGRLEYVSDAVSALFIAQDLEEKLAISLSTKQKEELAKGITFIRNRRYLDFRFKLIDQITMLDSIVVANGIANYNAVKYFTSLNDNWLYANNLNRLSGKRWSYYVGSNSRKDFYKYQSTEKYNLNNSIYERTITNQIWSNLHLGIDYDVSTQKSLNAQRTFGFSAISGPSKNWIAAENLSSFTPITEKPENSLINYASDILTQVSCYWGRLYQPNTRNTFTAQISPSLLVLTSINGLEQVQILPQVHLTLDYYKWISPQLNFAIGLRSNLGNNNYATPLYKTTSNNIDHYLNLAFNYQFF